MNYFESLPQVQAGTNVLVSNNITATINNTIERVFDFIVAEDVVLNFLKGKPALLRYEMEIGPWNHNGATRINHFEGEATLRETIVDYYRPVYFQYVLTEFKGGAFEGLVDLGIATFWLAPYGPRTLVNWQFEMRPAKPEKLAETEKFMKEVWLPWQQSFFTSLQKALDKHLWAA